MPDPCSIGVKKVTPWGRGRRRTIQTRPRRLGEKMCFHTGKKKKIVTGQHGTRSARGGHLEIVRGRGGKEGSEEGG